MATDPETVKEKHPSWFKLKIERRQLINSCRRKLRSMFSLLVGNILKLAKFPIICNQWKKLLFQPFSLIWKRHGSDTSSE